MTIRGHNYKPLPLLNTLQYAPFHIKGGSSIETRTGKLPHVLASGEAALEFFTEGDDSFCLRAHEAAVVRVAKNIIRNAVEDGVMRRALRIYCNILNLCLRKCFTLGALGCFLALWMTLEDTYTSWSPLHTDAMREAGVSVDLSFKSRLSAVIIALWHSHLSDRWFRTPRMVGVMDEILTLLCMAKDIIVGYRIENVGLRQR